LAKSKKLPNPTSEINIPSDTGVKMYRKGQGPELSSLGEALAKTFSFTATSVPSDWLALYENVEKFPGFYTPKERAKAELANIRFKAKQMLGKPFTVTNLYKDFGTTKFPYKVEVNCSKCGSTVNYIVDFFIHGILDHGNSLENVELVLEQILNRIESKIG